MKVSTVSVNFFSSSYVYGLHGRWLQSVVVESLYHRFIKPLCFFLPLECAKGLHLYGGRCYAQCPGGTYPSETLTQRASRRRNLTIFSEGSLGKVMKRRAILTNKVQEEADDMEPLKDSESQTPRICLPCHYTCALCTGPGSHHCTSCPEDASLVKDTNDSAKNFCYPISILPQITDANWHYNLYTAISIVLFIVSFIALYCFTAYLFKKCYICYSYGGKEGSKINVPYNKLPSDEKQQNAIEIQQELSKAMQDSSSDSDDDLHL